MRQGRFARLSGDGDPAEGSASTRGRAVLLLAALPALVCGALVLLIGLVAPDPTLAIGAATIGVMAGGLALLPIRARLRTLVSDLNAGSRQRAEGLLGVIEGGGETWFWETDAEGRVTYVSDWLTQTIGRQREEMIGCRFDELLLVEASGTGERPALGFHLGARFPFKDVTVSANGQREPAWLLSGSPRFDEMGRFLGFRGVGTCLTAERKAAVQSNRLARFDSLTGLPNRARMETMLEEAIANADSRKQSCALFLIDLDRFKQVNDTFGHPVGDVLLQQVAERLTAILGDDGQPGRLGGDEFKAVFPGIGEEGRLAALADRVIVNLSKPYVIHGHNVSIGASVGIAISRPGKSYRQALVKEADLALYAAKRAGRGTFRFYEPEMHAEETERKILESDLRAAVVNGQLKLLYQPVVSVATETLVGFEALVRWWHPTRGPLGPADFLPIVEASGQMPAIGEWILRSACAEAAAWPEHLRLTVNLSPKQLTPGLAAVLTGALANAGLAPDRLELDVQEAVLLSGDEAVQDALQSLQQLGIRLSIDDFGDGAASLASLKAAQVDRIKLHPSFLRSALPKKGRAQAVAMALVRLAEGLGIDVTAEGAETLEDLELIRALGCNDVQGFLFGRPMSGEEAQTLAANSKPLDTHETAPSRAPRHSLIRVGTLVVGKDTWPVRLRNISAGGAMIESGQALDADTPVELDLADGVRLRATVRWAQEGRLGLQFADAFDLGRLGKLKRETAEVRMLLPDYLRKEREPVAKLTIRDVRKG